MMKADLTPIHFGNHGLSIVPDTDYIRYGMNIFHLEKSGEAVTVLPDSFNDNSLSVTEELIISQWGTISLMHTRVDLPPQVIHIAMGDTDTLDAIFNSFDILSNAKTKEIIGVFIGCEVNIVGDLFIVNSLHMYHNYAYWGSVKDNNVFTTGNSYLIESKYYDEDDWMLYDKNMMLKSYLYKHGYHQVEVKPIFDKLYYWIDREEVIDDSGKRVFYVGGDKLGDIIVGRNHVLTIRYYNSGTWSSASQVNLYDRNLELLYSFKDDGNLCYKDINNNCNWQHIVSDKNGKQGVINRAFQAFISIEYDKVEACNGYYLCSKDGISAIVDNTGKTLFSVPGTIKEVPLWRNKHKKCCVLCHELNTNQRYALLSFPGQHRFEYDPNHLLPRLVADDYFSGFIYDNIQPAWNSSNSSHSAPPNGTLVLQQGNNTFILGENESPAKSMVPYDSISVSPGYIITQRDSLYGIIDRDGHVLLNNYYSYILPDVHHKYLDDNELVSCVRVCMSKVNPSAENIEKKFQFPIFENARWKYYNTKNQTFSIGDFSRAYEFYFGIAAVKCHEDDPLIFINQSLNICHPDKRQRAQYWDRMYTTPEDVKCEMALNYQEEEERSHKELIEIGLRDAYNLGVDDEIPDDIE